MSVAFRCITTVTMTIFKSHHSITDTPLYLPCNYHLCVSYR